MERRTADWSFSIQNLTTIISLFDIKNDTKANEFTSQKLPDKTESNLVESMRLSGSAEISVVIFYLDNKSLMAN